MSTKEKKAAFSPLPWKQLLPIILRYKVWLAVVIVSNTPGGGIGGAFGVFQDSVRPGNRQ